MKCLCTIKVSLIIMTLAKFINEQNKYSYTDSFDILTQHCIQKFLSSIMTLGKFVNGQTNFLFNLCFQILIQQSIRIHIFFFISWPQLQISESSSVIASKFWNTIALELIHQSGPSTNFSKIRINVCWPNALTFGH